MSAKSPLTLREKRVLDILADGSAKPASEFYQVAEQTLAKMAAKGWLTYFKRGRDNRMVYVITDEGRIARA